MAEIEQNRVFGFFRGFRETFKKILKISAENFRGLFEKVLRKRVF
jgi:hypothetical protein